MNKYIIEIVIGIEKEIEIVIEIVIVIVIVRVSTGLDINGCPLARGN